MKFRKKNKIYVKKDAGNVPYNNEVFNNSTGNIPLMSEAKINKYSDIYTEDKNLKESINENETKLGLKALSEFDQFDLSTRLCDLILQVPGAQYHSCIKREGIYYVNILGDNSIIHNVKVMLENSGFFKEWVLEESLREFKNLNEGSQRLNNREKKVYIDIIKNADDIEDLEDIVHELFFYDKALFVMLRHFPKDMSFEQLRDKFVEIIESTILDEKLNEASYGGAYDIEDDMYFTKDDLMEFIDVLIEKLESNFKGHKFNVSDAYFNTPTHVVIDLSDESDIEAVYDFKIDMRKIKKPNDLQKYIPQTLDYFVNEYEYWYDDSIDESLNEDINIQSYDELSSTLHDGGKIYRLFRKLENGKGKWAAAPIVMGDVKYDDAFEITYGQARGYEPISNIGKLSRQLGKKLLPKNESLNEKLVDAPQDVIDELLNILNKYGFVLDDSINHENPIKTFMGDIHIQVINPDSYIDTTIDDSMIEQIQKYATKQLLNEIHDLEKTSDCPITWSFGVNSDDKVTAGLDVMKQYVPDEDELQEDVTFRDEVPYDYDEMERDLKSATYNWTKDKFECWVKYRSEWFDAMKILSQHYENVEDFGFDEGLYGLYATRPSIYEDIDDLNEDTVKQGNYWVNKGKEGTHGKFKTKKAADAQRKAMFAQGYKENLDIITEDKDDEYIEAVRQADYEANQLRDEFKKGNKSIADILIEMEYEQDDPDSVYFYKEVDGGNAIVFDTSKYDLGENYIKYFVVDENDKIKQGYAVTKLIIDESLNESNNSYSYENYYIIDFGNCWVAKDSNNRIVCKRETSDEVENWIDEQSNFDESLTNENLSFKCPHCDNNELRCIEHEVNIPADVDFHEIFICDECGSEYLSEPQYDGKIKFKTYYESDL